MTDINQNTQPLGALDRWFNDSTIASATITTASQSFALAPLLSETGGAGVADRPSGEFTVDVFNASGGIVAVSFSNAAGTAVFPINGTSAGGYVINTSNRVSLLVPPNTKFINVIGIPAGTFTGSIYATTGHGKP